MFRKKIDIRILLRFYIKNSNPDPVKCSRITAPLRSGSVPNFGRPITIIALTNLPLLAAYPCNRFRTTGPAWFVGWVLFLELQQTTTVEN